MPNPSTLAMIDDRETIERTDLRPGDVVRVTGYDKDRMVRVFEITEVGDGYLVTNCLVRGTPDNPVYRRYYLDKLHEPIKIGRFI